MTKTIIRRFLIMIPQLIVLSLFIFFVAQKMPGDPFTGKITPSTGNSKVEEELKIKSDFTIHGMLNIKGGLEMQ